MATKRLSTYDIAAIQLHRGFSDSIVQVYSAKGDNRPISHWHFVSLVTANTFKNFARPYRVKIAGVLCTIVAVAPQNDFCDMFE